MREVKTKKCDEKIKGKKCNGNWMEHLTEKLRYKRKYNSKTKTFRKIHQMLCDNPDCKNYYRCVEPGCGKRYGGH